MAWGYHRWSGRRTAILKLLRARAGPVPEQAIREQMHERFARKLSPASLRNTLDHLQIGGCVSYQRSGPDSTAATESDQRSYSIMPEGIRRLAAASDRTTRSAAAGPLSANDRG
jgi:hypothetical protein